MMMREVCLALLLFAAAAAVPTKTHTHTAQGTDNTLVAVFQRDTSEIDRATHIRAIQNTGAQIIKHFNFGTFHAFAVQPAAASHALLASPLIASVEANKLFHAAGAPSLRPLPVGAPKSRVSQVPEVASSAVCKVQRDATWSLVRRNKQELEIDGYYSYDSVSDGHLTNVYVIDTGLYLEHPDFGGRAFWGFDGVEDPSPQTDPNGHGTFVGGIVAGNEFGVSKNATLVAVRVLNQAGMGSTTSILSGLEYTSFAEGERAVALLAFSGSYSAAINSAVATLSSLNIIVVAPVGNDGLDACYYTPSSEPTAISVAASDSLDQFYNKSNYGNCTDIIAPGVSITSDYIGNPYSQNTLTGTSFAAANVAGSVANLISGLTTYSPSTVKAILVGTANNNAVSGVPAGTPNKLLYQPCF